MSLISVAESDIDSWFDNKSGRYLLRHQRALVSQHVNKALKQQFVLEAGLTHDLSLWNAKDTGSIKQSLSLFNLLKGKTDQHGGISASLLASLKPRTMELTLVHHLLDFCGDQRGRIIHDLLEVTEYGGRLLIVGLNPLGFWPNWVRSTKKAFWFRAKPVSVYSLARELSQRGCIKIEYSYHLPFFPYSVCGYKGFSIVPAYMQSKMQKLCFPGCYYLITAIVSKPNRIKQPDFTTVVSDIGKRSFGFKPAAGVNHVGKSKL